MINDDILLGLRKPARYIGCEWNVSKKDFESARIRFAICFPDLYDVAMSNLGIRILYSILNAEEGVVCERCFAPDLDMETVLRQKSEKLFSLESAKPLSEFDIIGFSLGYELGYTNVLNMLELGGIALRSCDRKDADPLVIAGGPCVLNPEPMSEFFDLFVFGEAEEAIIEVTGLYKRLKGKASRRDLLIAMAKIEGVYVPSLHTAQTVIKKRIIKDLDKSYSTLKWLVPYIQIVHDRMTVEIMRGCPNRCRFCQARSQYYPYRQRSCEEVVGLAEDIFKDSGYEEISLAGLSVSDHTGLDRILGPLTDRFKRLGVSLSLPSIKPKTNLGELTDMIATIKKTGLTFAPEAGSERLRRAIGKNFNEADFFKTLEESFAAGYQHVKLYFMIGLPYENQQDLQAILDFSKKVSDAGKLSGRGPAQVNISINTMIPKPHTPFQWCRMIGLDEMKEKQDYLRLNCKSRRIKLNFHNRFMSYLEGVLTRGDRRLGSVIYEAFKKGARFDGWQDHFNIGVWSDSFRTCGIDPEYYLRERAADEALAWDHMDVGLSKAELLREYEKSRESAE